MDDSTDKLLENENSKEIKVERRQSRSNENSQETINSTKNKNISDIKCTIQNIHSTSYQVIILSFRRFQSSLYFTKATLYLIGHRAM